MKDTWPDAAEYLHRTQAAIAWLRRSIDATGGQGSAHSWHPLLGWNKSYPETTGYIIPTLLDYAAIHQDDTLKQLALDNARWLTTIQLPSGAFPGLLLGNQTPSVFNTAQILFGLTRAVTESEASAPERKALENAVKWLLEQMEPDGSWQKHAFVTGFSPSYYTRAVLGVLMANSILQKTEIQAAMQDALTFYATRFTSSNSIQYWGFKPNQTAFTHTIAYTLEGFLECALLLNQSEILNKTIAVADQLLRVRQQAKNRTAGRYEADWTGDYSFICVTGNAQLSILYQRLFDVTQENKYQEAAYSFLMEIIGCQQLRGNKNRVGGLPGSIPFWGPYLPFRYPNWATKFYLDAFVRFFSRS